MREERQIREFECNIKEKNLKKRERARAREDESLESTDGHVLVVGSVVPKREESALTAAAAASASETQAQAVENFARLYTALRHEDARPLCRYCGRSYSSPSNLRQHVKNVHSNWPPPDTWPQCNVCGKRCKTKHYLINHQLQAHGIHQRPSLNNPNQQQQQHHQSPLP